MRELLLCAGLLVALPTWGTEITWSVKNGFPVFKDAKAFQEIKKSWPANATAAEFLAGRNAQWFRDNLPRTDETLWNSATGVYNKQALFSKQHVIVAVASGAPEGSTCRWYLRKVLQSPPQSCNSPKEITVSNDNEHIPLRVRCL